MESFFQDLQYAFRTLRKAPAFTLIAVTCLSLGIATNTTMFSAFNAILLRPFPFSDPDRLAWIERKHEVRGWTAPVSYKDFSDWRAQTKQFSELAANGGRSITITEGDEPERLNGQIVTANLFPMLGVRPQLGRLFLESEDQPGAPGTVLLSDAVWRRRYAGDSSIVNRVISVNNLPHTVVGVMPPRFKYPERAELWLPAVPLVHANARENADLVVMGRLAPGATMEGASRELRTISERVNEQFGSDKDWKADVAQLAEAFVDDDVKVITSAMMGAVMFVLLIACANVANLMLTRAAGRSREIAVRAALGAGRGRIVRQLLTESVIVAVIAGVIAIPLTKLGINLIYMGVPPENPMPYYMEFSLDRATLIYTVVVSLLTGVLFGLAPALQISRGKVYEALKEGGRGSAGGMGKSRTRNVLVIAEVALSLVLLVGASLFARSFMALQKTEVGYDTRPILTMRTYMPGTRYDSTTDRVQGVQDLLRRVSELPGVQAAAISNLIPMDGGGAGGPIEISGSTVEKGKEPSFFWTGVAGGWFETMGIKAIEGRIFTDAETHSRQRIAVIDEYMAKRLWPKGSAMGGQFRLAGDSSAAWFTVIGVVPEVRNSGLDNREHELPTAYLPYQFLSARNNGLMVRAGSGDPLALTAAVRRAIRDSDQLIPVFAVQSLEKVRQLSFWQYKLFGAMFGAFGVVALFLAAIGVYGVISFGVTQRTRDFGVRVALGASSQSVVRMVVRQGVTLAAIGIGIGLVGAFGVTRAVSSILIGVSPTDPVSFGGVALFLVGVAALASIVPARRATAVDPIVALGSD